MARHGQPKDVVSAPEDESVIIAAAASTSFECDYCGSTFGRQEHLTRHKRSHTREKPYTCSTCGKSFSRLDVLTRHAASHREGDDGFRRHGVSTRACQECAASRTGCSRDQPCRRCTSRGLKCKYPTARRRKASSTNPNQTEHHDEENPVGSTVTANEIDADDTPLHESDEAVVPGRQAGDIEAMPLSGVEAGLGTAAGLSQPAAWTVTPADPESQFNYQINGVDQSYNASILDEFMTAASFADQAAGISAINWLSPQYYNDFDLNNVAYGTGIESHPSHANGLRSLTNIGEVSRNGPWLNLLNQYSPQTQESGTASFSDPIRTIQATENMNDGSTVGSAVSASTTGTYYVDGDAARAPFKGRPIQRRSVISGHSLSDVVAENPSTSAAALQGEDDGNSTTSAPLLISAQAYEHLIFRIKTEECLQQFGPESTSLPSLSHVRVFFRLYFQRFHVAYPFLRTQTSFYESPANWLLLLAVCAVGSRFAQGQNSHSAKNTLSSLLEKAVSHQALHDPSAGPWQLPALGGFVDRDVQLIAVQAALLHVICKLHGAKGNSMRSILTARHFLQESCRNLGLLEKTQVLPSETRDEDVIQMWIEGQSRIRTGMMIWVLEIMMSLELEQEPLLKLGDVKVPLPCSKSLWDNPTMEKITQYDSRQKRPLNMPEALEMLYMEKKLPPDLDDFSTLILTYAIFQRTKEATYHHQVRLASWTPTAEVGNRSMGETIEETWPPSLPILSRWRNSACDCLDLLHWNANAIIAKAGGWEHPPLLHLHLSRLGLLTPMKHLRTLAAAASARVSSRPVDNSKVEIARAHVVQWASRDQYKARLSIIHAGALLWHVRRYSVGNFLEPFGIFSATLVVWAYSTVMLFLKQQDATGLQVQNGRREGAPDSGSSGSQPSPLEAVTGASQAGPEEEPEPTFLHLDRPCDDEMVQTYVKLGHKMSGHMSKVGDICREGAPKKILQEGIRMLTGKTEQELESAGYSLSHECSAEQQSCCVWGVEHPFVDLLGCLVQSTED